MMLLSFVFDNRFIQVEQLSKGKNQDDTKNSPNIYLHLGGARCYHKIKSDAMDSENK